MEKKFDFNSVGKRMPYRVPDGFFAEMERKGLDRASKEALSEGERSPLGARKESFWRAKRTLLATAAITVALLVMTFHFAVNPEPAVSQADVETAFDNLNDDDQAYMLAVYADDVFLEEQEGF